MSDSKLGACAVILGGLAALIGSSLALADLLARGAVGDVASWWIGSGLAAVVLGELRLRRLLAPAGDPMRLPACPARMGSGTDRGIDTERERT